MLWKGSNVCQQLIHLFPMLHHAYALKHQNSHSRLEERFASLQLWIDKRNSPSQEDNKKSPNKQGLLIGSRSSCDPSFPQQLCRNTVCSSSFLSQLPFSVSRCSFQTNSSSPINYSLFGFCPALFSVFDACSFRKMNRFYNAQLSVTNGCCVYGHTASEVQT